MQFHYLPGDLQYILDGAMDAGEITAFDYSALFLYGDPKRIDEISNEPRSGRGWAYSGTGALSRRLDLYAADIARQLPIIVQRGLMATAIIHAKKQILDLAQFLAGWNYEDSTTGGAMQPFRRRQRCDRLFNPTPRVGRELRSPSRIRRYVRGNEQFVLHHQALHTTLRAFPWPDSLVEAAIIDELNEEHMVAGREHIAEAIRFIGNPRAVVCPLSPAPYRIVPKPARKKLIKAYGLACAVLGATQVAAFAANQPVVIHGKEMGLELTKMGLLTSSGHGGMQVRVLSPEGVRLGALCVYFDNTPVLDQLAAFALHMDAGEEKAILNQGNLYAVTAEGAVHPLIKERVKTPAADGLAQFAAVMGLGGRFQLQRDANTRYFGQSGHHYIEALETRLWGRDVKRYRKLVSA